MNQIYNPHAITITDKAAKKVQELIALETEQKYLRVYITGGGCNGFQYCFTFDNKINPDDTEITHNNTRLVIDELSYQYLIGGEIDHTQDLRGSKFTVSNPNATSTCSCGSSFSV